MATIALENEMYREAVKKESLVDKLLKYYHENAEMICAGLAAMNGQSAYSYYRSLSK